MKTLRLLLLLSLLTTGRVLRGADLPFFQSPKLEKEWVLRAQSLPLDKNKTGYEVDWITYDNSATGDILSFAANIYRESTVERSVRSDGTGQTISEIFAGGYPKFMASATQINGQSPKSCVSK